jgi:hypothetical protein
MDGVADYVGGALLAFGASWHNPHFQQRVVTMATLPTPEESARAILAIFKSKNVRPNAVLMAGQVNLQFLTSGGTAADYKAGLEYACERGWLTPGTTGTTLVLTDTGFTEM